jgi:hypothetical protein
VAARGGHTGTLISARLSYDTVGNTKQVIDVRFRILRGGLVKVNEAVPHFPGRALGPPRPGGAPGHPTLSFPDLDGDGEPEVVLNLADGAGVCCRWWRVYHWNAGVGRYQATVHLWGRDASPTVERIDGKLAVVSSDQRFAEGPLRAAAPRVFPVQVWAYHAGSFTDVTWKFPELVRRDAAEFFTRVHAGGDARAAAAAWAADEVRLHDAAAARTQLDAWAAAGLLDAGSRPGPGGAAFVASLWHYLHRLGYR